MVLIFLLKLQVVHPWTWSIGGPELPTVLILINSSESWKFFCWSVTYSALSPRLRCSGCIQWFCWGDLISRLWCDWFCWYRFVNSVAFWVLLTVFAGLLLLGLGSMLMMVLLFLGMLYERTTLFVICLCGPDNGLIHTSYIWALSRMHSKHSISKCV